MDVKFIIFAAILYIINVKHFFYNAYTMYRDGFKSMTIGRKLWLLIFIKLAIIFLVIKLFFFPDKLATEYDTDQQRAIAVREALISPVIDR